MARFEDTDEFAGAEFVRVDMSGARFRKSDLERVWMRAVSLDGTVIEAVFLATEADHAARKMHLTAEQAGLLARQARAKAVLPFHFSPRYMGREDELRAELEQARGAGASGA